MPSNLSLDSPWVVSDLFLGNSHYLPALLGKLVVSRYIIAAVVFPISPLGFDYELLTGPSEVC